MEYDLKILIKEQIKKKWYLFYILIIIVSLFVLKSNFTSPYKIVALFLIIISQFVYNKKVKFSVGFNIIHWILFFNLILISLAYLFALFEDYDVAAILLLSMISVVLFAFIISSILNLWKLKDSEIKKPTIKLITIIISYLALAIIMILSFSFFFTVAGSFQGHEIVFSDNNLTVNGLDNIIFYSGTVFYSSVFGNMVPNGLSRELTLVEYIISFIIHIILLGIVVSSFVNNAVPPKK